jgi:hypothetical protein
MKLKLWKPYKSSGIYDTYFLQILKSTMMMIMFIEWDYVSELWPLTDLLFIPQVIRPQRTMVEWHQQEKTPDSSIRVLWYYQQLSCSKAGGIVKGNYEFGLTKYLCSYLKGIFNMLQNLMAWGQQLYLPSECCRFISPLKIHHPQSGMNPWTLVPMASMLTTRPLRAPTNF